MPAHCKVSPTSTIGARQSKDYCRDPLTGGRPSVCLAAAPWRMG